MGREIGSDAVTPPAICRNNRVGAIWFRRRALERPKVPYFRVAGWRVSFAAKIAVSSTRFIVTRIMTSSLTCRSILYQDGAGLVLFVIFRYKVAEIVTSWARSKII